MNIGLKVGRSVPVWGLAALLLGVASVGSAAAGDAEAGKARAAACFGCHGPKGKAPAPNFPNLAGQKAVYLENALKAYRDGGRVDPIMKGMAAPLSDADIANLAAFFSSQPR